MQKITITKKAVWDSTKYFALLIMISFVRALGSYMFIIPNRFAPGGIGGIASIIYNGVLLSGNTELATTVFDPGIVTFVLNIPILIAGFCILNKRFVFNTLCVVATHSAFMSMFAALDFPVFSANGDTGLMLLAALAGGAISGIGMGIMLRHNMCLGGTDILAKFIYRKNPSTNTQWWIFILDTSVAVASGSLGLIGIIGESDPTTIITRVLSPIFYSFISLFVTAKVGDIMQAGMLSSIVFNIVSDKADEIATEIGSTLHRGVTVIKATGHYTGNEHAMLVCIVSKKQVNTVKSIINRIDQDAFTYIMSAGEVAGKGFRRNYNDAQSNATDQDKK